MNKKLLFLTAILISALLLISCKTKDDSNHSKETQAEDLYKDMYGEIPLNRDDYDGILSLIEDKIIYYQLDADNNCFYYSYNIADKKVTPIGKISNFVVGSFIPALIGHSLYLNVGTGTIENLTNELIELDIDNNKLNQMKQEKLYQSIVLSEPFDNLIVSLKGDLDKKGNKGITFIDTYDKELKSSNIIIEKYVDMSTGEGEVIKGFDLSNNSIYTLQDFSGKEYQLGIYDINGTSDITMNADIIRDSLNNQFINTFLVFDQFVFANNISGDSVLCRIKDNELQPIVTGTYVNSMLPAVSSTPSSDNSNLFFIRDSSYLFYFNPELSEFEIIDRTKEGGYTKLKNVYVDGGNVLYSMHSESGDIKIFFDNITELRDNTSEKVSLNTNNITYIDKIAKELDK